MSKVLLRKRKVSDLEYWRNGTEIRAWVTRYLMSENHVPKRWRPIFTFPGIDLVRKLMEEITAAHNLHPVDEAELLKRRSHQTEAILACEQIFQHLQWLIDTLQTNVTDFDEVAERLDNEITLLRDWRKRNRIITRSSSSGTDIPE